MEYPDPLKLPKGISVPIDVKFRPVEYVGSCLAIADDSARSGSKIVFLLFF
jgi:hypothetical protein